MRPAGGAVLEVLEPGLLTTIQDAGRPDWVHLGVPVGGACDPWSLGVANVLAGNDPGAAAIEITLAGPTFAVSGDCLVGLAGADLDARLDGEERLAAGRGHRLQAGQTLTFGTAAERSGIRAYLALSGGVDVPLVLGSSSTCLVGGFGGLTGRALSVSDVLRAVQRGSSTPTASFWSGPQPAREATFRPIRVVSGPHLDRLRPESLERLVDAEYQVSARGDRQAIVLEGPPLASREAAGTMLSQGVVWGAVQVPPDGNPICLLADHQTVGGYPVVAVVITADLSLLGQLGPGDPLRFSVVDLAEARRALEEQRQAWQVALAKLHATA